MIINLMSKNIIQIRSGVDKYSNFLLYYQSMENVKFGDYKTELLKSGVISFVPKGNSMWPIIKNRGQSVVIKLKEERLKKYDVAFYVRKDGAFVLHRVVEVKDDGYVMCGDSQFTLEPILEEQVFGVMIGFYHGKKYIESNDTKYIKRVEKWYKRKTLRKIRLKTFFFTIRVKNKLKSIFKKLFGR
ncbi:MAG: hypothetical protein E7348_03280 [Clostridiales bacterium]|nr:hypothetical protein [Clostridiales bacterium]